MRRFSIRNGYQNVMNHNDCEKTTRSRIWQVYANHYIIGLDTVPTVRYDSVESIMAYYGIAYEYKLNPLDHQKNINKLRQFIVDECEWYKVYDFVEYVLNHEGETKKHDELCDGFNRVLDDEHTGYHIIDDMVTPITNQFEISEIEEAIELSPEHVQESVRKSIKLFSDKTSPDYNNAIKEIITAVEALCRTIAAESGFTGVNSLTAAVDKLEECGITLHVKMKQALKELYWYTCDEDGKRHGGTTYVESDVEDARFMIITCSAIINFLLVKWSKAKEKQVDDERRIQSSETSEL